ncbi:hypothetical protein [Nitrospira sp. BLG_2]|uniref:hypothetical protein n=1 Tax=Nitrospira sp. BLG_2 TaxID=3397507 RepID=UPI003B9CCF46
MPYSIEQLRDARKRALAAGDTKAADELLRFAQRQAIEDARGTQARESTTDTGGTLRFGGIDTGIGTSAGTERVLAGIGRGMTNVARHAGNLVGLTSDEDLAAANQLDIDLMNTTGGKVGSFIGETAATALPIGGGTVALARTGALGARLAGNMLARGALEGAAQGALMADPGQRAQGAMFGAGAGAVLPALAGTASKAIRGVAKTPEAEALLREGVDLTPGQMNPLGVANQMEESWQSVPLVGSVIRGAREGAAQDFQRVTIQKAAMPGTKIATGSPDKMLQEAYDSFQPFYDAAKGFPVTAKIVQTKGSDIPLSIAFANAAKSQSVRASSDARKSVNSWLQNELTALKSAKFKGGTDDSAALLDLRSNIRAEGRKAISQNDTASAELLEKAEDQVTRALESQLPKSALNSLKAADAKYGQYKVVETAVARAKDKAGGFTASDLSEAVAQAHRGANKGSYARGGGGDLRQLAHAGKESMSVVSPPTGARMASIVGPAALALGKSGVGIPVALGALGLTATKTGRRLAAGSMGWQQGGQRVADQVLGQLDPTTQALIAQYANRAAVGAGLGMVPAYLAEQ